MNLLELINNDKLKNKYVLVNCYQGIGDLLTQSLYLEEVNKKYKNNFIYPENLLFDYYKRLGLKNLKSIRQIDKKIRRLVNLSQQLLLKTLKREKIGVIINLRRDLIKYKANHTKVIDFIRKNGVYFFDLLENFPIQKQNSIHNFQLSKDFFSTLGIHVNEEYFGWLCRRLPKNKFKKDEKQVGFFIGGSNIIKRMKVDFWLEIIKQISRKYNIEPFLISGVTHQEIREFKILSTKLKERSVKVKEIFNLSLYDLSDVILKSKLIVSADSFMVPFAEALGVNVVGIYTATNGLVYGPQDKKSFLVQSPYYFQCPYRNLWGNCDGWDAGCKNIKCSDYINSSEVIKSISKIIDAQDY